MGWFSAYRWLSEYGLPPYGGGLGGQPPAFEMVVEFCNAVNTAYMRKRIEDEEERERVANSTAFGRKK